MVPMAMARVRSHLREVLDTVRGTHERVVVTRNGKPQAVIMAVEDLESLEETLEIMRDAELMAQIKAGEADVAAGRTVPLADVRRELNL